MSATPSHGPHSQASCATLPPSCERSGRTSKEGLWSQPNTGQRLSPWSSSWGSSKPNDPRGILDGVFVEPIRSYYSIPFKDRLCHG